MYDKQTPLTNSSNYTSAFISGNCMWDIIAIMIGQKCTKQQIR